MTSHYAFVIGCESTVWKFEKNSATKIFLREIVNAETRLELGT